MDAHLHALWRCHGERAWGRLRIGVGVLVGAEGIGLWQERRWLAWLLAWYAEGRHAGLLVGVLRWRRASGRHGWAAITSFPPKQATKRSKNNSSKEDYIHNLYTLIVCKPTSAKPVLR